MKRVLVKSVFGAFEYVMLHFYPFGQEEMSEQTDTYAVISIQDTHTGGFGFQFNENKFCKGVLTLYFDDNVKEVEGAVMFSDEHAEQIIDFIQSHKNVDTLLVHCYGGQSRSRAVGAFAVKMLGEIIPNILKPESPTSTFMMYWKLYGFSECFVDNKTIALLLK